MVATIGLHNVLIAAGLDYFDANALYIAVGDGTTTPTKNDTTLSNETYREGVIDGTRTSDSSSKNIFLDAAENNGNDMNEIGVFDEASNGDCLGRSLLTSTPKNASTEAFYTIKLELEVVNQS